MISYGNSSYWLGDDNRSRYYDPLTGEFNKPKGKDLIQLSSYRRAIANFVSIVTGENIPVTFKSSDSFTDGKSVVLAGNLSDKNFDVAVGLALHEGSHIKLTDFDSKPQFDKEIENNTKLINKATKKGISEDELRNAASGLLNIVEDRRIDKFIQQSAPGYKGYYGAMYDHYFNASIIDKALLTKQKSQETLDDYMFHITNFINPNRQLDDLKGLRKIWNILDLGNISRLTSTEDAKNIALEILEEIIDVLPKGQKQSQQQSQQQNQPQDGEDETQPGNSGLDGGSDTNSDDDQDLDDDGSTASGSQPTTELSKKQREQLEKAIEEQKNFLEGETKKTNLSKKELKQVDAIQDSKTSIEQVDYTDENYYGEKIHKKTDVVVIRELNDSSLKTTANGFQSWHPREVVADGMRIGKMLGKKLQVRNDDSTTIYNRQKRGKIDRRLLADLGVGNSKIFEQTFVQMSNEADIHISIDASGSMGRNRWDTAMKTAIAIAKACDVVGGVDVRIDMRMTDANEFTGNKDKPMVLIAYDSTKHGMNHIKKYFNELGPGGTTPEGICFKAIQDIINVGNKGKDRYFINMSDGAPDCQAYEVVTKEEVKKMKQNGIKVLSYFIDGYNMDRFEKMYGKESSVAIETTNLMQIAKTMNKLLSKKS